jgi:pimeloyl-ACP methyl ester carboxylesterase
MSVVTARRHGASGPILVFVHGWCCNVDFWRLQVQAFADRFRLILIDLGHPDPAVGDLSIEAAGREVAAYLTGAGIQSCVLIGHSMGGPVALEAALHLGERCHLVIGIDTFADAAFYARCSEAEIADRLEPFRQDFRGAIAGMVDRITLTGDADVRRWIGEAMASAPIESALARLAALLAWDIAAVWPRVQCPVAAINSATLNLAECRIVLPTLREVLLADVGHFPMLEDPVPFNDLLTQILRTSMDVPPPSGGPD